MKIFISGLLNIETTVKVRKFPIEYYPIDYPFFGINSFVSGVGYNLAKAFQSLGDYVNLFSYIGKDIEGEIVLHKLQKDGIDSSNVISRLKCTPVSTVLFDENGKRQIYCDLKDIQEQYTDYKSIQEIDDCDLYVICNTNFNRDLIKKIKKNGKLIATDVHVLSNIYDEYNKDFMKYSDILFVSDENLPCPPVEFLIKMKEIYDNRIIVIGMGEKGAVILDEHNKIFSFGAVQCEKVLNTVGAGDALFSSFLHFYMKGYSGYDALIRAEIFASIKIGFNGASIGFSDEETIEHLVDIKKPVIREIM